MLPVPIEHSEYSVYATLPNDEYVLKHEHRGEPLTVWEAADSTSNYTIRINGQPYQFSRIILNSDLQAMTRVGNSA